MTPPRSSLHPFALGSTTRRPATSLVMQDRGRNRRIAYFREQTPRLPRPDAPSIRHSER